MSAGRLLVIDDAPQIRRIMRETLTNAGYEVDDARTGVEGLEKLREFHPDLVLLDMNLPEMDGIEVCRAIRNTSNIAIIMLTVRKSDSDKVAALDAGADDFVTKPYDPEELRARLMVAERIVRLQEHVRRLEGVLPTCMYCKKIRDDRNVWVGIEQYITQRTEASFSHGVCPEFPTGRSFKLCGGRTMVTRSTISES